MFNAIFITHNIVNDLAGATYWFMIIVTRYKQNFYGMSMVLCHIFYIIYFVPSVFFQLQPSDLLLWVL